MTALGLASIASVVDLVPSLVLRHRPRQPTFWGETPLGQARSTGCLCWPVWLSRAEQLRKMHGLEKLIKNACNCLLSVFTSFGTGNSRFK